MLLELGSTRGHQPMRKGAVRQLCCMGVPNHWTQVVESKGAACAGWAQHHLAAGRQPPFLACLLRAARSEGQLGSWLAIMPCLLFQPAGQ